jgi:hypothetical protein
MLRSVCLTLSLLCATMYLPTQSTRTKGAAAPVTPEQELVDLRPGIANTEPITHAYLLSEIAQALVLAKSPKAGDFYEDAVRTLSDFGRQNAEQADEVYNSLLPILKSFVQHDRSRTATLLDTLPTHAQSYLRRQLIASYMQDKNFDRAVELVISSPADKDFPYGSVCQLIKELPSERDFEVSEVYQHAVAAFLQEAPNRFGDFDLTEVIRESWRRLPRQSVLGAVDLVLSNAKTMDEREHQSLAISNGKGANSFSSSYQWHEARLLPIIDRLDPQRAEQMRRDDQQLASLSTSLSDPNAEKSNAKQQPAILKLVTSAPDADPADIQRAALEMKQQQADNDRFQQLLKSYPRQALAFATSAGYRADRTEAITSVLDATLDKDPQVAADALDELAKQIQKAKDAQDNLQAIAEVLELANKLYLRKQPKQAQKAFTQAVSATGKVYEAESDPDDTNLAAKI